MSYQQWAEEWGRKEKISILNGKINSVAADGHKWNDKFCSCGKNSVICQIGGESVCVTLTVKVTDVGNVCLFHNDPKLITLKKEYEALKIIL